MAVSNCVISQNSFNGFALASAADTEGSLLPSFPRSYPQETRLEVGHEEIFLTVRPPRTEKVRSTGPPPCTRVDAGARGSSTARVSQEDLAQRPHAIEK